MAQRRPPPSEPANKMILSAEGHGPDGAFDRVVVELDAAVIEESAECWPARERITDRLGQGAVWRDTVKLVHEPDLHGRDEWSNSI